LNYLQPQYCEVSYLCNDERYPYQACANCGPQDKILWPAKICEKDNDLIKT